ncbi:hypothetical protein ACWIUD_03475 [Helicobacter sp. 23-1044]
MGVFCKWILRGILLFNIIFAESIDSAKNSQIAESSAKTTDSAPQPFVLQPSILNDKTIDFINKTSLELFNKTNVNLYVVAIDSPSKNGKVFEIYDNFKGYLMKDLQTPFVAIIAIKNQKKIDIITSDESILTKDDKKKIYWEYMVPLLPQKDSEAGALSAVVFNGYVEAVDLIAQNFGVEIKHNVAKNEKGAKLVAQGILYLMLFSLLGLFAFVYFFKRTSK